MQELDPDVLYTFQWIWGKASNQTWVETHLWSAIMRESSPTACLWVLRHPNLCHKVISFFKWIKIVRVHSTVQATNAG